MQDALPAFVLNSETLPPKAMSEMPTNPGAASSQAESQPPELSDERLMLAFTQGSSEAFTELFHRYKQPIYGFFCRRVSDPANAEELTQETFFAVLRAAARYEPRALFRTYLYAIGFKILRAHRRKAAFRTAFLGQHNSAADPAKKDATEASLWVRRAVERLDPLDREIVMLREFEQLSYSEIADLLQLPLNTLRSRLSAPAPRFGNCSILQARLPFLKLKRPHQKTPLKMLCRRAHRKDFAYEHQRTSRRT